MTIPAAPQPKCGAQRRGKTCEQVAGWGTDHVGWGACKLHGGSTRNGRAAALRQAGEAMMRADVQEIAISPAEAQIYPVHRMAALVWLQSVPGRAGHGQ